MPTEKESETVKISEMNIEQLRKHFAELSRDQLLLSLQTREAQLEAAQQSVQADKPKPCENCGGSAGNHHVSCNIFP